MTSSISGRKPLPEEEVVVHVPKGTKAKVRVEESDPKDLTSEITIQVSKQRKPTAMPVIGVIVK
ncbi:hypothetical protein ACVIGB_004295 [Bradyrhizobium sp. USDA 4341]